MMNTQQQGDGAAARDGSDNNYQHESRDNWQGITAAHSNLGSAAAAHRASPGAPTPQVPSPISGGFTSPTAVEGGSRSLPFLSSQSNNMDTNRSSQRRRDPNTSTSLSASRLWSSIQAQQQLYQQQHQHQQAPVNVPSAAANKSASSPPQASTPSQAQAPISPPQYHFHPPYSTANSMSATTPQNSSPSKVTFTPTTNNNNLNNGARSTSIPSNRNLYANMPTGAELSYVQIMDDGNHNTLKDNNDEEENTSSNRHSSTFQRRHGKIDGSNTATTMTASTGSVAQWFALETTAEDRLSWNIITNELKELFTELYHFARNRHWKKKLLTVAVALVSVLVFWDLLRDDESLIKQWIDKFLLWMTQYPTAAEFVYMGIWIVGTLMFIPPTLLLLGAGWAFTMAWHGQMGYGVVAAVVACFVGSVLGALASFVRARYMMRDLIDLFAKRYPIVKAADKALQRDGLRIMLLLRLCPLIPFHGLNYLGGITQLSWQTFVLSLVGMLPYQILIIIMGASAGSLAYIKQNDDDADNDNEAQFQAYDDLRKASGTSSHHQEMLLLIVTCTGIATLIIAMILTFRFTKKELQKELQIGEGDMECYISTVRRMSIIDLEWLADLEDDDDDDSRQDGLEVPDSGTNPKGDSSPRRKHMMKGTSSPRRKHMMRSVYEWASGYGMASTAANTATPSSDYEAMDGGGNTQ